MRVLTSFVLQILMLGALSALMVAEDPAQSSLVITLFVLGELGGTGMLCSIIVRRFRPDGTLDFSVSLPLRDVTSVTFGGADLRDLYVTTAADGAVEIDGRSQAGTAALFHGRAAVAGQPIVKTRF